MRRVFVLAAVCGACLLVPLQGSAAPPADVTCSQDTNFFTGTARDLIVPEGGFCEMTEATITHDLIVEAGAGADVSATTIGHNLVLRPGEAGAGVQTTSIGHDVIVGFAGGLQLEQTTIGHDLIASKPQNLQTGRNCPPPDCPGGTVTVGHDLSIDGTPDGYDFVFGGMCALNVGHDMKVTNWDVTLGIGIGDNCAFNDLPSNTIANDLVVTDNMALEGFFGPSAIEVGNNHVGKDLVFKGNSATPPGYLEVRDNVVGRDAICASNTPAVSGDAFDGPNVAGRVNTCG